MKITASEDHTCTGLCFHLPSAFTFPPQIKRRSCLTTHDAMREEAPTRAPLLLFTVSRSSAARTQRMFFTHTATGINITSANHSTLYTLSIMRRTNSDQLPTQSRTTTMTPSTLHMAEFPRFTPQTFPDPQHPGQREEDAPAWSAVQHDFQRRLNRFGIRLSEDNGSPAPSTSNKPTVHTRGGAGATFDSYTGHAKHASLETDTVLARKFETLSMPSYVNSKEAKIEALERQLSQARAEARGWKEKCEAQERRLRESYKETMGWRMKYEDLYTDFMMDQRSQPEFQPEEYFKTSSKGLRGNSMSLG